MKIIAILKKIVYYIFTTICSLAMIYVLIQTTPYIVNIFRDKDAVGKNIPLRDDRQKFDVLLVGASHMGAILPAQLWNRHGISSYNSYSDGNGMRKTASSLKMSLQYCKPELVIIECETWWLDPDFYDESGRGNYHHAFDSYPLFTPFSDALYDVKKPSDIDWRKVNIIDQFKLEKLDVVNAFIEDQAEIAKKTASESELDEDKQEAQQTELEEIKKEMSVPFYTYHSRWQELTEKDFAPEVDVLLGGRIRHQSNPSELPERIMNADYIVDDEAVADIRYVEEAIQVCQEQGVEVLLVCLPYVQGETVQGRHNKLYDITEKYGVKFINMMYEKDLVNYSYDFRDPGHMNLSGGTKCADFLAEYIKGNYGIEDRRGNPEYDSIWKENYALFKEGILDELVTIGEWAEAANYLGLDEFEGELYLANPADEYEEFDDYEYLDDEIDESEDEEPEDESEEYDVAEGDSENEEVEDAESADTEDYDESEEIESDDFEMCHNPGKLGLIQTIKKNGYKIYGIEKAVELEVPYLIRITRDNGEINVEEFIGDDIQNSGVTIPEDCDAWTCIRDSESKEVCLERSFE